MEKCKHGWNKEFCCTCRYGNTGHHHESPDEENPKDFVDDIAKANRSFGSKSDRK